MIRLRASQERGFFDHGWLKTYHSFSFSDYFDPQHVEFGPLRVINEDFIQAGAGFPTHGHRDMEIITYVLEGAVAHKDSTGGEGVVRPGEIQMMTAGSGIRHSEFNGRQDRDTHLYQIWIRPAQTDLTPGYLQRDFTLALDQGNPVLLVSPKGEGESLKIHQDIFLWARRFKSSSGSSALAWDIILKPERLGWLQIAKGKITLNGNDYSAGDGIAISDEEILKLRADPDAEVLFFDMAKK